MSKKSTIILKANNTMNDSDREEREAYYSKKLGRKVVIIDSRFDVISCK